MYLSGMLQLCIAISQQCNIVTLNIATMQINLEKINKLAKHCFSTHGNNTNSNIATMQYVHHNNTNFNNAYYITKTINIATIQHHSNALIHMVGYCIDEMSIIAILGHLYCCDIAMSNVALFQYCIVVM